MVHSLTQRDKHWLLRAIVRKQYAAPCACRASPQLGSDTHPAGVKAEGSNHVWDPFLPVFLVNRLASLPASNLSLLKGMCTSSVCLRDQHAVMGGTQTLCHHCYVIGLSDLSDGNSNSNDSDSSSSILHQLVMCQAG